MNAPRIGLIDYLIAFVAGAVLMLVLSTCLGCSVDASGLAPGSSIATSRALSSILASYGAPALAERPSVQWVSGDRECHGVAWLEGGRCVRGHHISGALFVATWGGAAISQTSLAHEALHWLLWRQGVAGSDQHLGDFYERVERANAELWRSGQ